VFAQHSLQPKLSRRRYASVSYALKNNTVFRRAQNWVSVSDRSRTDNVLWGIMSLSVFATNMFVVSMVWKYEDILLTSSCELTQRKQNKVLSYRRETAIVRAMNVLKLPLTVFTQRNFVADFLQAKFDFTWKKGRFAFLSPPPLWELMGNVRWSS